MKKSFEEVRHDCELFIEELSKNLIGYTMIESCNKDESRYLIPIGTENDLSYYSKPVHSFRYSDHWNWYSNVNKCSIEDMVQCNSVDIPWPKKRESIYKATKPIFGIQVAYYGDDNLYHSVYGFSFDRKTKKWNWIDNDPKEVAKQLMNKSL